jgi:uncharacterized DUF497 family protein
MRDSILNWKYLIGAKRNKFFCDKIKYMQFNWDREKAKKNLRKHKVSFDEALTVFYDPLSATFYDPNYSVNEERFITIGYSSHSRLLVVSHIEKEKTLHIISARPATAHERKRHES